MVCVHSSAALPVAAIELSTAPNAAKALLSVAAGADAAAAASPAPAGHLKRLSIMRTAIECPSSRTCATCGQSESDTQTGSTHTHTHALTQTHTHT